MNKVSVKIKTSVVFAIIVLQVFGWNSIKEIIATPKNSKFADSNNVTKSTKDILGSTNRYWNDLARYLAGLKPKKGSVISAIDNTSLAKKHRSFFQKSWAKESKRLTVMEKWRKSELPKASSSERTVFYPFSGPDFNNVFSLFPNGKRYILFGLEKPGSPPDVTHLSKSQQKAFLSHVQHSLASILRLSFFRTLSMKRDFHNKSLDGLNPILLAFMARKGGRILDVTSVRIGHDGKLYGVYSNSPSIIKNRVKTLPEYKAVNNKNKSIPGIRIQFIKKNGTYVQELIFLSFNVSNHGLQSHAQFTSFVKTICPCNTYLKAASYLMHRNSFSKIRDLVLSQSEVILEDDSGIPYRFFESKKWGYTFYGTYNAPIPLFKIRLQKDLHRAYRQRGAKSLPFGIGYNWHKGTSNLLLATKKYK